MRIDLFPPRQTNLVKNISLSCHAYITIVQSLHTPPRRHRLSPGEQQGGWKKWKEKT